MILDMPGPRPAVILLSTWLLACSGAAGRDRGAPVASAPVGDRAMDVRSPTAVRGEGHPDVRFVRGMIAHHGQALRMTGLASVRAGSADLRLLARRIELTQQEEIDRMRRWLVAQGQPVAADVAHGGTGHNPDDPHAGMPGMLTHAELARLEAESGAGFDRLFLELMIRHHEGALDMVAAFLATPGAVQDADIHRLAADVDADQRAEINRMRNLLAGTR